MYHIANTKLDIPVMCPNASGYEEQFQLSMINFFSIFNRGAVIVIGFFFLSIDPWCVSAIIEIIKGLQQTREELSVSLCNGEA